MEKEIKEPLIEKREEQENNKKGLLINLTAQLIAVFCLGLQKYALTNGILVSDFLILRTLVGVLILSPILFFKGLHPTRGITEMKSVLFRSFLGCCGIFFFNFAFTSVPVSQIMVIFNTYPIMASVFSYFINGEKILKIEIAAIAVCFIGVALFAISKSQEEDKNEGAGITEGYLFGIFCCVLSAVIYGINVPLVRKMRKVNPLILTFWVNVLTLTLWSFLLIFTYNSNQGVRQNYKFYPFLAIMITCLLFLFVTFLTVTSQQLAKTGLVVLVAYIQIPLTFLLDLFVFDEKFDYLKITGLVLICLTVVYVAYQKIQQQKT